MNQLPGARLWRTAICLVMMSMLVMLSQILTAEGESTMPKFVLMRLEDVGPGGQYGSLDQLGKLRAVLEYLQQNDVPYHLAIIPRWIDIAQDGTTYDVTIGQQDNLYAEAFNSVLKQAIAGGAIPGMHGYTHQVGSVRRGDGHQESGIGNEFNVDGIEETTRADFAYGRMKEGLRILQNAGIRPAFWETPHYHSTAEQDAMLRNFFGLNYQADVQNNRNAPEAFYMKGRNAGYGVSTLGAAYIPTPFDYIPYNKDEKFILDRIGKSNNIASFFYHPFLEFKYLIPVTDSDGVPVERDGIPVYMYPSQDKSVLQKLLAGLKAKGYTFYSVLDYAPFTPAHSIPLGGGSDQSFRLGDVSGDGQADIIQWDRVSGSVNVTVCDFTGLRNSQQPPPKEWARIPFAKGAVWGLEKSQKNGKDDLWILNPSGSLSVYASDGSSFALNRSWTVPAGSWDSMTIKRQPNGDMLVAGLSRDRMQMNGIVIQKGQVKWLQPFKFKSEVKADPMLRQESGNWYGLFVPRKNDNAGVRLVPDAMNGQWKSERVIIPIPNETGEIRFGDFNGDGKEDVLRVNAETWKYTVYLQTDNGEYRLLSTFGPWGKAGERLVVKDMDGNGKTDLAIAGTGDSYVDVALSFETK